MAVQRYATRPTIRQALARVSIAAIAVVGLQSAAALADTAGDCKSERDPASSALDQ
jgi:hypothetical protein